MSLPAGTKLGPYVILAPLGSGGMGEVYRATDSRLGREVAVKVLTRDAGSPVRRERFLREAQAASALNHPGIVTVHDVGREQGVDFIVMERVEGRTLRGILDAGPVPVDEALGYARQAAAALAVAHAAGIVHRDLKPQNLMVTPGGQLKVLDFGLACVESGVVDSIGPTKERLTEFGTVVGTPGYMSPEQIEGKPVDVRTDVFSLGIVLYEMLTGKAPFGGSSAAAVLYEIVHRVPEPAVRLRPGLGRHVTDVLDAMLRKDPAQRLADGGEVLAALTGAPLRSRTERRGLAWAVAAAAAVLLGCVVVVGLVWRARHPSSPEVRTAAAPAPGNAYDRYLEGLELVKRWDKGTNLDDAIRLFREAAAEDPSFALAFARLADAERIKYALTRDRTWLDAAGRSADEAVRLNPGLAPVQVALGRIHGMRGSNDLAFAAFERALAIDANDPEANQAIARQYERLGRLEDAEASYRKALSLDPENLSILDAFANFLFRQGRFEEAVREWRAVIRLAPDNAAALVNLGSALSETGRFAEAITLYERAVSLKPSTMAYSNLGTAYSRAERYPEAAAAYRKALELDGEDWLAWGNLAYVSSWMGGMDARAVEAFERAIRLAEAERKESPRDASLHSQLALYYAKTGDRRLSLQRLSTALTLSPGTGQIQADAAEVYELLGMREKAVAALRRSLDLGFQRQQLLRNPELSRLLEDPRMKTPS
ncbi:MAG: tetratricopeptide repeat protein [Holophagales bacterium]|nr:tetratricopeptide repeat protein [Holophagales bacterium]